MLENINMTQIDHLPQMYPSKYDIESASEIIESINSYVVIHVGGQDEIRKLRTETLIEVIDKMHLPCVLVGGMEDSIRSSEITAKCKNTLDLTGKISLNQLYVILLSSSLCIAPDSSVMHIASVAGTKLIAIMGNAFPQTYGPFPVHSNIRILTRYPECSPCSRKMCDKYCGYSCLQDITQNEIMHCVNQLL
jgi:ADP-heptose:LPS heptosyltransferase